MEVNGQRERRRHGVANFYFNFQVGGMIGFVPRKNIHATFPFGSEEEGGKCEPAGFSLPPPPPPFFFKLENVIFFFLSFFCCHHMSDQSVTIRTQAGVLPDQPPETGAHSLVGTRV